MDRFEVKEKWDHNANTKTIIDRETVVVHLAKKNAQGANGVVVLGVGFVDVLEADVRVDSGLCSLGANAELLVGRKHLADVDGVVIVVGSLGGLLCSCLRRNGPTRRGGCGRRVRCDRHGNGRVDE